MAEFETIKSETVKHGNNKFIEVGHKRVTDDKGTSEFLMLSKGYFTPDGDKKYKGGIGMPNDAEAIKTIFDTLMEYQPDLPVVEKTEEEIIPMLEKELGL